VHEVHAFNGFDFVFDARAKVKGRVRAHFETAKAAMESDPRVAGKLSDLVFRDDRKFVPLQAADLLAYGAAQMRVAARARPRHRAFSLRASEGAPSTPTRGTAVSRPNAALLRRAVSRNAGSGGGGPRNERHTYDHRALARTARSGGLTRGERLAACAENC